MGSAEGVADEAGGRFTAGERSRRRWVQRPRVAFVVAAVGYEKSGSSPVLVDDPAEDVAAMDGGGVGPWSLVLWDRLGEL